MRHRGSSGKALGTGRIEKTSTEIEAKGRMEGSRPEAAKRQRGARRLTVSKLEATSAVASHCTDRRPALHDKAFGSHISQIQL